MVLTLLFSLKVYVKCLLEKRGFSEDSSPFVVALIPLMIPNPGWVPSLTYFVACAL